MPRPGPRPYECVRRAWHSDRQQPMRGSIIQQIFRVVHDSHSTVTKKNKEWKEKLPIVVLKAEEIMYSKANSESEYMDLDTLWDRVNDAINTIIRREETTETGKLLPPCVEAALNLGCVPVRASRSQRHSNPRSYLSPRSQDLVCTSTKISDTANKQNPNLLPLHSVSHLTKSRATNVNSAHLVSDSNISLRNDSHSPTAACNFPPSHERYPPPNSQEFAPVENNTSLNFGSVYPLYYGSNFHPTISQKTLQSSQSNTIIVGRPIFPSVAVQAERGCLQNLLSCNTAKFTSREVAQVNLRDNYPKSPEMECDLSLRLGLSSDSCMSRGKGSTQDNDDFGLSISQEIGKDSGLLFPQKGFSFFPVENADHQFQFCASSWNSGGLHADAEATGREHKVPFDNSAEVEQIFRLGQSSSSGFTSQGQRPGL